MSAVFSLSGGGNFTVGGGGDNPYPRYSIDVTTNEKNGLVLGSIYTISVTGTFVATGDITSTGARANSIRVESIAEIKGRTGEYGTLVINGPGGANPLTFTDCKVVSVTAPEQDDTSQGVLTQDFSATFEALKFNENDPAGTYGDLQDMSESWDWAITETNVGDGTNVARDWTATLSVSATGRGKEAYDKAKTHVTSRTSGADPFGTQSDLESGSYSLDGMPTTGAGYAGYNKITSRNVDIAGGTYSETITWVVSKFKANVAVDLSSNFNRQSPENTVDVSVTVTGQEDDAEASTSSRYTNALEYFNSKVKGSYSGWVATFYSTYKPSWVPDGRAIQGTEQSLSITENETDGVITLSATFSDKEVLEGVFDQSVTVSDNNIDGGNQVVAILPVIAKANGPVIQDMATTGERTRSISVDLTMDLDNRTSVPYTKAETLLSPYIPVGVTNLYRQNRSTSWNPQSGSFNLTEDYVWTDQTPTN